MDGMDKTGLAGPLYDCQKRIFYESKVCSNCFGMICRVMLSLFVMIASIG